MISVLKRNMRMAALASVCLGLTAAPAAAQLEVWKDYEVSDAVWSMTLV